MQFQGNYQQNFDLISTTLDTSLPSLAHEVVGLEGALGHVTTRLQKAKNCSKDSNV